MDSSGEGKVYLCAIKDVYSNRIVGHSISDRMTSQIAVNALVSAVQRRGDVAGCIVHSDRDSQFRSRKVARVLARHELLGSMGQVASAGDNAAMENFFSLLQKNVLDWRRRATRDELRLAIVTWIKRTYHRRRRQARLGRLTPIEYETINTPSGRPRRLRTAVTYSCIRPHRHCEGHRSERLTQQRAEARSTLDGRPPAPWCGALVRR